MHFQKTLVINFYGLNSNRGLFLFLKMRDSQADLGLDQVHSRISLWNVRWPVRVNRVLNQPNQVATGQWSSAIDMSELNNELNHGQCSTE